MSIKKSVVINSLLIVVIALIIMVASGGTAVLLTVSSSVFFAAFMPPFYYNVKRFTDIGQPEVRSTYVKIYWGIKMIFAALGVVLHLSAVLPAIISFVTGYFVVRTYEWHVIDKIKEDETII